MYKKKNKNQWINERIKDVPLIDPVQITVSRTVFTLASGEALL